MFSCVGSCPFYYGTHSPISFSNHICAASFTHPYFMSSACVHCAGISLYPSPSGLDHTIHPRTWTKRLFLNVRVVRIENGELATQNEVCRES